MQLSIFSRFFTVLSSFFNSIFGRFSWASPPWMKLIKQKMPVGAWLVLLGMLVLVSGYFWYQHLPKPNLIVGHVTAPDVTPVDTLIPNVLYIDFGKENNGFTTQSVAPLSLIGKNIEKGIQISPDISGTWQWVTDSRLQFTPKKDWDADQAYTIKIEQAVFTKDTQLKTLTYTFNTQPFKATIAEYKFYQNPTDANSREAVATINFNYPVDPDSLEKHAALYMQKGKTYQFSITYDKPKRTAYIHSEQLTLPDTPSYLVLQLTKGIKSVNNSAVTTDTLEQNVLIPDAQSYFKISKAEGTIVRNERDQPIQFLNIESTIGVLESTINQHVHAYLLPKDKPATIAEAEKSNYQWQNPGEVTSNILLLATPVELTAMPADRQYATLHSYKLNIEQPGYIYLVVDKGIQGFGGYVLANAYTAIIKVPEYPKEIGFLHKGSLISLSDERKLSVTVRGLPAVKFAIARVLPDDVNQLVTQTNGDYSNPYFFNYSFNKDNISEIFSEIVDFDAAQVAKAQYTALDLGKYLSSKANPSGPLGLFLLQAQGWDNKKKEPISVEANRLVLITDLGILVKDNRDSTHDVFVQSISQGKPVANAVVSVLGKNGLPIVKQTTDSSGHVNFASLNDYVEERQPTVYLVQLGSDISFIPYNSADRQLNFSRFDVGGAVTNNEEQSTLSAFIFSDRGVYRPGDMAHIATIVKKAYAEAQPAGLPLQVTITDPRGATILNKSLTLDETGYLTFDYPTQDTSPTGQYTVSVFIVKDNKPSSLLGSAIFKVAEFLPDRMHITAHLSEEAAQGWVSPIDLSGKVTLTNLYGAPAADRKISSRILLSPQAVKFQQYPDYVFVDPLLDPKKPPKVFTEVLADTKTDAEGNASIPFKLERFDKATYQLTFFAEGFEAEGGRSVSAQTTMLVSPLSYLVGYKPEGDLKFIKQNAVFKVNFIALNNQLKPQAANGLILQLLQLRPVTTLVKNDDGTYQYQSIIYSNEVSRHAFNIDEKGTEFTLPADKIGDFQIKIIDQKGTDISHLNYSIVGQSQQPLPKNAELSVKLDKSEYLAGNDIEMEVTSPYTGSGLITIERDKVYAYQWFQTNTTTSMQKIHIPDNFQGGGYVTVTFVRDWNSPEIFMSPLSFSTTPFTVNKADHTLKIQLQTPEVIKPGTTLNINYQTDKPGKIIVFAVDEGILQVTDYKTPDPLAFFFQKRALEVNTQQILDLILPRFISDRELSAVGGDHGETNLGKYLNPFKRKTDLPVVYWSGILDTDTTLRTVNYNVPDYFNGSLRIMAVAVAANALGSAAQSTKVRGDFIINPNIPTFVAPGDEFEISASIANNLAGSGSNASVNVQVTASPQLELLTANQQVITITEGKEGTVKFKFKAKSELGAAFVMLKAGIGGNLSKMTTSLSIRPASTYLTTVKSGYRHDADTMVKLDRELYPNKRSVEAAMSSSPLILVYGLQRYLDNYPFGCTEQLVSKAFPLLSLASQPWFAKDTSEITAKIQATMQMLNQRQLSSGGFSYWPDMNNNSNNVFDSVYAMHFLTDARAHGYDVPRDMFSNGISFLKDLAAQSASNMDDARIRAYAIYILTRNEIVTTNYLTNLQLYLDKSYPKTWKQDIISVYMASTYLLLKDYPDAERLINVYQPNKAVSETSDFYSSEIANAQYLYLIAKHFPEYLTKQGSRLVDAMVATVNSDEMNTVLSSYTALALSTYVENQAQQTTSNFSITETLLNGKSVSLSSVTSIYQRVAIDAQADKVHFLSPDKLYYFYQLTQTGFDKKPSNDVIKQHIEIQREYHDSAQNVVSHVNLGQEIEVHVKLRGLDNSYQSNIAIIDLLPGGFEVVPDSINRSRVDYADIREDRVILFTSASPDVTEFVYRIKSTNVGVYVVPAITASSMYNPTVVARGEGGASVTIR